MSVLAGIDAEANDGPFPQCLGGLQPMQPFDKHKACAVRAHQDWRLLTVREHTVRYLLDAFGIKRSTPPDWHVDGVDREGLAFHHDAGKGSTSSDGDPLLSGLFLRRCRSYISGSAREIVCNVGTACGCHSASPWKGRGAAPDQGRAGRAKGEFAWLLSIDQDVWTGDRLSFRASALGQTATGFIDVYEAGVRVEVTLPWLLARFAHAAQRVIGQKGQLMLEKK